MFKQNTAVVTTILPLRLDITGSGVQKTCLYKHIITDILELGETNSITSVVVGDSPHFVFLLLSKL